MVKLDTLLVPVDHLLFAILLRVFPQSTPARPAGRENVGRIKPVPTLSIRDSSHDQTRLPGPPSGDSKLAFGVGPTRVTMTSGVRTPLGYLAGYCKRRLG